MSRVVVEQRCCGPPGYAPDIVVGDIDMPGVDGYQVMQLMCAPIEPMQLLATLQQMANTDRPPNGGPPKGDIPVVPAA